ncbi:SH3 domain-containing protein [Geminocystis sp. CENA526]|uniref:SH3 domain-containing protein n=1 Tax=Geminocystis sp. CENA526 TaxID=1355871 RepID=UPI003D6F02C4
MKYLTLLGLILINVVFSVSSIKAETVCKVTDPTGTPLNVRTSPNGKKIGILTNGKEVYIDNIRYDEKGRPWARVGSYVSGEYKIYGWVFREFISCYER